MRVVHVTFRGNRQAAKKAIKKVYSDMAGGVGRHKERLASNVAAAFFGTVHKAFDTCSKGGVAHGIRWEPNSPETLAYSKGPKSERFGVGQIPRNYKGQTGTKGRLGRGPGTGMLTNSQLADWWVHYRAAKNAMLRNQMPVEEAKRTAARYAYKQLGSYATLVDAFGTRPHLVMVAKGRLRKSFEPTTQPRANLQSYRTRKDQVVDIGPNRIAVGTKVPHAKYHHHPRKRHVNMRSLRELKGRRLTGAPQRRLWPEYPDSQWKDGIKAGVAMAVQGAMENLQRVKP